MFQPSVLLFDEPLSNLDAKLRADMRIELRELQHRLGITSVYVTHDLEEALAMSDRIVVMRDGKIEQIGLAGRNLQSSASAYGVAHVHKQFPNVWSRITCSRPRTSRPPLPRTCRRDQSNPRPTRVPPRKIELMDDEKRERPPPEFRALGWLAQCDIVMVAHRPPDEDADTSAAEQVELSDLIPVWQESWSTDPDILDEDVVRQLTENRHVMMGAVRTRASSQPAPTASSGASASSIHGKTAQIENVFTLERLRRRGLSRATVSLALETARSEDHDLIFLLADREDWPQRFYERLGFETIGQIWEFILSPRGSIATTTEEES